MCLGCRQRPHLCSPAGTRCEDTEIRKRRRDGARASIITNGARGRPEDHRFRCRRTPPPGCGSSTRPRSCASSPGLGICTLYDAGRTTNGSSWPSPWCLGRRSRSALRRGPLSVRDALRVGIDVAAALDVAHGAGMCHRDVKPANIIVDGLGPVCARDAGRLRVRPQPWLDASIRDDLVGTVRYLAPESAGSLAVPSRRAVGPLRARRRAVRVPGRPAAVPGPTVGDLLRQHLSMPVPDLRSARRRRAARRRRHRRSACCARIPPSATSRRRRSRATSRRCRGAECRRSRSAHRHRPPRPAQQPHRPVFRRARRRGRRHSTGSSRSAERWRVGHRPARGRLRRRQEPVAQRDPLAGRREPASTVLHGQGVVQAGQRPFTLLLGVIDELVDDARRRPAARAQRSRATG